MSDLQNPLFDEEKEFLERKKLEYERALRGDVDHIKDQSVKVGKIAAVGVGLAGGIWLISKAFGGKKKKKKHNPYAQPDGDEDGYDFGYGFDQEAFDQHGPVDEDDETSAEYYTAGNGKRYKSKVYRKSAADSAQVFGESQDYAAADDRDFATVTTHADNHAQLAGAGLADDSSSDYDTEEFEDDPFQDLPYDDSRRLPSPHSFDAESPAAPQPSRFSSGSRLVGEVLQSFLKTDTGKVLVGQVAAVALALVTKKVSEFFPAEKKSDAASENSGAGSDLAASTGYPSAETGLAPVASSVSPDSPDASTHSQPV